jgi:hypothetical protein
VWTLGAGQSRIHAYDVLCRVSTEESNMKFKLLNNWKWSHDYVGFVLFNIWRVQTTKHYRCYGILILNLGFEFTNL